MVSEVETIGIKKANRYYEAEGWIVVHRIGNKKMDVAIRRPDHNAVETIEEKHRDWANGDILLEILQAPEHNPNSKNFLGWIYHCEANYLGYFLHQKINGEWTSIAKYLLCWIEFRNWFWTWLAKQRKVECVISPKGMGITINIPVPITDIPDHLFFRRIEPSD